MTFQPAKTFVNLAVQDLQVTMDFFQAIGFSFNPMFTNEDAACMVINESTYVMLLTHDHFRKFTKKAIANPSESTEVLIALTAESREQVDQIMNTALQSGGRAASEPQDHGFMYQQSFQDPDGHIWEVFYMDESAVQA
ncbi:VOC family protein [Paenibacillus sp. JX-17]|uniref:VOC family protein n=1 Tax=Paenibacillus lacisoli TaxID=3064525 RepID=A0ABT9CC27_9BACL|nr:VOC family protein [Paenibacillus sp. JX-17]MDO7906204.1 VOC family protein [Paenibacillus sp. JX-17]